MKKRIFLLFLIFLIIFLIIYPFILIDTGDKLIKFGYNEDVSEFENASCYDESYFYNEDRNISIYNFDFKKFLFYHVIVMEHVDGNKCATEYLLEESYIEKFLNSAVILDNKNNINLEDLIKNRTAVVGNNRYFGNDFSNMIEYVLDGKNEIMYIFYDNDMIIIQVGLSDEGPMFIAYR